MDIIDFRKESWEICRVGSIVIYEYDTPCLEQQHILKVGTYVEDVASAAYDGSQKGASGIMSCRLSPNKQLHRQALDG